jgi:hypothetical protein
MTWVALALASAGLLRATVGAMTPYYDLAFTGEASRLDQHLSGDGAGGTSSSASYSGSVSPSLGIGYGDRLLDVNARYSPTLTWDSGADLSTLHGGAVATSWRMTRHSSVTASLTGSYGTKDFWNALPPLQAGAPQQTQAQALPTQRTIKLVSVDLSTGLNTTLGPRAGIGFGLGAFVNGGLGGDAATALPMTRGGRATTSLGWSVSRDDAIGTSLDGNITQFTGSDEYDGVANLGLSWRHSFSPETSIVQTITGGDLGLSSSFGLSAGGAYTITRKDNVTTWSLLPSAQAEISGRLRAPVLTGSLTLGLTPFIDRLTFAVYQRANAGARVTWSPSASWSFGGNADVGWPVGASPDGVRVVSGELRVGWSPDRPLSLFWGVRGSWQETTGQQTADGAALAMNYKSWSAFVGLTYRTHERF